MFYQMKDGKEVLTAPIQYVWLHAVSNQNEMVFIFKDIKKIPTARKELTQIHMHVIYNYGE